MSEEPRFIEVAGERVFVVVHRPHGPAYFHSLLRINLTYQLAAYRKVIEGREQLLAGLARGGAVNIEGYELSGRLFHQGSALSLTETLPTFPGRVLLIDVAPRSAEVRAEVSSLAAACRKCDARAVTEEPLWKETKVFCQRAPHLSSATIEWLEHPE